MENYENFEDYFAGGLQHPDTLANQIEKNVNSGNFYPNESGFGCGDCPYTDRCKKWR